MEQDGGRWHTPWRTPVSMGAHAVPGTTYRVMAAGGGTPFDVHAVTRSGDDDPLAAAFLACLRAARDERAGETLTA